MLAYPLVERGERGESGLCMAGQMHFGEEVSQPGNSDTFGVDRSQKGLQQHSSRPPTYLFSLKPAALSGLDTLIMRMILGAYLKAAHEFCIF